MIIKRIKLSNFKSFNKLDVVLDDYNVLIGANASGKSNFVEIFRFLRDIANFGLENAIGNQNGIEYLRNINIRSAKPLSFEVLTGGIFTATHEAKDKVIGMKAFDVIYKFTLGFKQRGLGYEIIEDKIIIKNEFTELKRKGKELVPEGKVIKGKTIITKKRDKVDLELIPKEIPLKREERIYPWEGEKLPVESLLLEKLTISGIVPPFELIIKNISIFDVDSRLSKKPSRFVGKANLEEDGKNLATVLKNLLKNSDERRKLYNLINDILPFVGKISIEKSFDKTLLIKLKEIYTKENYLPASIISDGTVKILNLLIALYFDKRGLTIIEEPEINIHPYLISKLTDMIKDASANKQIVITTHNPELVKHADKENILLISRDKKGFSIISKPGKKEEVKTFLKNEIGIDELYVQNLLGL